MLNLKQNTEQTKKDRIATLVLNVKHVVAETEKSILYAITENEQLWIPVKALWTNQIMTWTFKLPVYANEQFEYSLITDISKPKDITKVKLVDLVTALESEKDINLKIEK